MAGLDRTSTRRRTGAVVVVSGALWGSLLAPAAAHASPPAHAAVSQQTDQGGTDAAEDRETRRGGPASKARGRDHAPGQATTPGRSGDAPGRQPTTAQPPADPGPTRPAPTPAPSVPTPTQPAPTPPAPTPPAPAPSPPTPSAPATSAAPRPPSPAPTAPAGASSSDAAGPAAEDGSSPTARGDATDTEVPAAAPAPPPSTLRLLHSTVEAATGTADRLRGDLARSVGDAATVAARRLTPSLGAAPDAPLPARDLGLPMGVLALLGGYLAVSRWLDRGGLPMTITDGQEDDVEHVL